MKMGGNRIIGVLAALLVALPGAAHALTLAPDVGARDDGSGVDPRVEVLANAAGIAARDVLGETVSRVLVRVTNNDDTQIVLVTVKAPAGVELATAQDPAPAGWAATWTRTAIQFVGALGKGETAAYHLRLRAEELPSGAFDVSMHAAEPGALPVDVPRAITAATPSAFVCQVLTRSTVDGSATNLPFATLSEKVPTSAEVLVAVYDPTHRVYVDPARVTGLVFARTVGSNAGSQEFAISARSVAPWADAPGAPVLSNEGALPVASAPLWGGVDEGDRLFFLKNPGAFQLYAFARVDGRLACTGALSALGATTPVAASGLAPMPFALVPPELDSDGDSYLNVNELRANSNPLRWSSTPYSDDDRDGLANGRDPVNAAFV